ncbi:hypothetical protein [Staphylococcus pseudoxylosus]|uniref:hypothetical protein n=1 Tax=Staphylococcus pseudoxylosus TaxID=2282419 RepID=UPI00398B5B4B
MGKIKDFLNRFKWILIGALIFVIIITVIATLIVKNHKVNVEDDVKVDFSGYNKSGQQKSQMTPMKKL